MWCEMYYSNSFTHKRRSLLSGIQQYYLIYHAETPTISSKGK